ncbi:hypothetical protein ACFSUS_21275 [Spirosoma soli]|uniref:Phosphatidylinositol diacylglycerol-lyase n=1 Tax=Spirosoma soli TaxID=1770529 RepID=A0ABW5M8A8_9BACT
MDRSNWMSENLELLGNQPLNHIVMPAAHDAGMCQLQNCSIGANTCNTQTQTLTILEQLQNGIRYFDLRPVISGGTLYTGHYSHSVIGFLGCCGPALTVILEQVSTFMQSSHDLVILKFSHYIDVDTGQQSFSQEQMTQLCSLVTSQLQNVLYDTPLGSGTLADVLINQYIGSSGKVLAVFDQLTNVVKQQFTGVYSYGDMPGPADLVVFDQYSNTNDLNTMISDQFSKLANPANHTGNLFLLSWTLTQSPGQAVGCGVPGATSILDLADQADAVLYSNITAQYNAGKITLSTLPNLLYVDNADSFVLDVAMWLNTNLLASVAV